MTLSKGFVEKTPNKDGQVRRLQMDGLQIAVVYFGSVVEREGTWWRGSGVLIFRQRATTVPYMSRER